MTRTTDRRGAVVIPPRKRVPQFADADKLLEVLRLIAAGYSNAMIARKLHLSDDGVKSRVRALLDTLGAVDRAHAVHIAHNRGILHPEDAKLFEARRKVLKRHRPTCALLQVPACDCQPAAS